MSQNSALNKVIDPKTQDSVFELINPDNTIEMIGLYVLILSIFITWLRYKKETNKKTNKTNNNPIAYVSHDNKLKQVLETSIDSERKIKEILGTIDKIERSINSLTHKMNEFQHTSDLTIEKISKNNDSSIEFREDILREIRRHSNILLGLDHYLKDIIKR